MIHWKKFLEFEARHRLFSLEEDGIPIWDVLRFHVYLDYLWPHPGGRAPRRLSLGIVVQSIKRLAYLVLFFFRRSRPNLFFIHSRDRRPDGRFYDKNAHDFLQRMAGDSHILETCDAWSMKYVYSASLFSPASLFNRLHFRFYRHRDYSDLLGKINAAFGLQWNNRTINRHLSYFKSERKFYSWLFRMKKPRRVYATCNHPKALFCAARERGVETIEFQHGIIDRGHIAYHYPPSIGANGPAYCPDILLTFSGFWCRDIHYPVKRIIPAGNTILADIETTGRGLDPASRVIGFISGDVFGRHLADLAMEYARLHPEHRILFKLHPNQLAEKKEYDLLFRTYPAIQVITNEEPTEKVVLSCDAIVLIQSTIAYLSLQAGIPVFIYKRMTYYRHAHIFHSPNVRLVDDATQIALTTKPAQPCPGDIFFEEFDERVYLLLSNGGTQAAPFRNAEQATGH